MSKQERPLVSIITPSYNCSDTISATAESILSQTYTNWEWLISDDCSDVKTLDTLTKIASQDKRIQVFESNINGGAAIARNNSIENAKGDYIAFLDSDDLWLPNKIESQLSFMQGGSNKEQIDFSFTAYQVIDETGQTTRQFVDINQTGYFVYRDMLCKQATLGCSTVMLRRNAFEDISMPLLRTGQDYGLWLKLLKTGAKAYVLAQPLTQYRIMPNSISRNKVKKAKRQWQIYRQIEKLSLLQSVYCFCFYAWRAVFRR